MWNTTCTIASLLSSTFCDAMSTLFYGYGCFAECTAVCHVYACYLWKHKNSWSSRQLEWPHMSWESNLWKSSQRSLLLGHLSGPYVVLWSKHEINIYTIEILENPTQSLPSESLLLNTSQHWQACWAEFLHFEIWDKGFLWCQGTTDFHQLCAVFLFPGFIYYHLECFSYFGKRTWWVTNVYCMTLIVTEVKVLVDVYWTLHFFCKFGHFFYRFVWIFLAVLEEYFTS